MRTHRLTLFAAVAFALAVGSDARSAGTPPDDIVFLDSNLEVTEVSSPRLVLSGKQFMVDVRVSETTGNVAAYTQGDLQAGQSSYRSKPIPVPAGGSRIVTFPVTLNTDGAHTLEARLPESEAGAEATV